MKKWMIAALSTVTLLIVVAGTILISKESKYTQAAEYAKSGKTTEAYRLFLELKNYRNSASQILLLQKNDPTLPYRAAEKWDIVTLGTWEQDGDPSDGPEPLEWFVIDICDEGIMLLTCRCIECLPYNAIIGDTVWESCSLRSFLNSDFYESAFTESEKAWIALYENENPGNDLLNVPGGPNTNDYVFLLSGEQKHAYLGSEEAIWDYARAGATEYAKEQGVDITYEGFCSWWLRGPGNETYSAQFVQYDGETYEAGAEVDIDYSFGVRPVVCLNFGNQ